LTSARAQAGEHGGDAPALQREFARWPFPQRVVPVRLPDLVPQRVVTMACKNLSCSGAGLVGQTLIAPGTRIIMGLRSSVRGVAEVEGEVTRCDGKGSLRFEVGVRFTRHIDVREFVPVRALTNQFLHERVDPARLRGLVVVLAAGTPDRSRIARALSCTCMTVMHASGMHELPASMHDATILVLGCDTDDETPGDALLRVYERSFSGRVVLLAPQASVRIRRMIEKLPVASVLLKPFGPDAVLRAIAQALHEHNTSREDVLLRREAA
jgi:hypothetical protein